MKLRIWQQFSSNHSASYTIVGVFPSQEAAKAAGDEIRTIVEQISTYVFQNRDEVNKLSYRQAIEIERQLGLKYGFEWNETVDWLHYTIGHILEIFQRDFRDSIFVAGNLVIVDTPPYEATKQTGHQFTNLIRAMGGQAFADIDAGEPPDGKISEFWSSLRAKISCTAPNEDSANMIYQALKPHFDSLAANTRNQKINLAWAKYNPQFPRYLAYAGIRDYEASLDRWLSLYEQQLPDKDVLRAEAAKKGKTYEAILKDKISEFFSSHANNPSETIFMLETILDEASFLEGHIRQNGKIIVLDSLRAGSGGNWATALSSLILWLTELGCDLSYEFSEEVFWTEK